MIEQLNAKKILYLGTEEEYHKVTFGYPKSYFKRMDADERYSHIISRVKEEHIQYLMIKAKDNYIANRILWDCDFVEGVVIVDGDDPYVVEEKRNKMSSKHLWDFIAVNSESQATEAGWYHYFSREPFSEEEMQEFSDNVYYKLEKYLDSQKIALEIGCGSGFTMFRLAPYLKAYIGTDMVKVSLKKNEERMKEKNIRNITQFQCEANALKNISFKGKVDIVIISSVIQCFPGINYLKDVICQSCEMMNDEGIIYLGDIQDLAKRDDLQKAALEYKRLHPQVDSRTDFSDELFLDKRYFGYLGSLIKGIYDIQVTNKIGTIRNELTDYRYDVIMHYKRANGKMQNNSGKNQYAEKIL